MVCICILGLLGGFFIVILCLQKGKQIVHVKRIFAFFKREKYSKSGLLAINTFFSISYTPLPNRILYFRYFYYRLNNIFFMSLSNLWLSFSLLQILRTAWERDPSVNSEATSKILLLTSATTSNSTLYFYTTTNAVFDTTFFWPISNFFPFFTFWLVG